jgi:hypothetical protein
MKKKMSNQKFCSIQRNKSRNGKEDFSCYTVEELTEIAKKLRLPIPDGTGVVKKQDLWKLIDETMKNCGGKEWCWAKKLNRPDLLENVFLPEGPYTGHEWLSNFDIDNVLSQYEIAFPEYKYVGCFSIEVSKVAKKTGMDDPLDVNKLYNWIQKYKYVGGVFNLDCYTCPGTHWTNFMIANTPSGIELRYYDSVGNDNDNNKIPSEIFDLTMHLDGLLQARPIKKGTVTSKSGGGKMELPKTLMKSAGKKQVKPTNKNYKGSGVDTKQEFHKGANYINFGGLKLMVNGMPHQRGDSECGVYSIHVQDLQINGHSFEEICKMHLPDSKINTFRQIYFRPC